MKFQPTQSEKYHFQWCRACWDREDKTVYFPGINNGPDHLDLLSENDGHIVVRFPRRVTSMRGKRVTYPARIVVYAKPEGEPDGTDMYVRPLIEY